MYQIYACIELYQWRFGYQGSQFGFEIFFASQKFEAFGWLSRKSVHRDHPWDHLTSRGEPADEKRRYAPDMHEATRRRPTHRAQLTFLAALETMREMGIRWGQERGASDTLSPTLTKQAEARKNGQSRSYRRYLLLLKISLVS